MSFALSAIETLDYAPCRYGASKLDVRGPQKDLSAPYLVCLGGTETYGRFVGRPFPDLLEDAMGQPVVNLGYQNAGVDAFLYDPDLMTLAKGAQLTVVQVMGAQNMSNRFYRVHPRRNDRFIGPSKPLRSLFPEVDFTEFSFTRHMLSTLRMVSPERFGILRDELQQAWRARMKLMLQTIHGPVVLLWLRRDMGAGLGDDPLFVDADMVAAVAEQASAVLELEVRAAGGARDGMIYGPTEGAIAAQMLNVATHHVIADRLFQVLPSHL